MPLLFIAGHRIFFLSAGLYGGVAMGIWLWSYVGGALLSPYWHGHEMIFGFAGAAIAGFLSAAVANWTGRPRLSGYPLLALFMLWLLGRFAVLAEAFLWVDLLFLPLLALRMGLDIVAARNKRNFVIPFMLFILTGLNALYHYGDPALAMRAAIYTIAGLIALIGGRIVPAFTRNALQLSSSFFADGFARTFLERLAIPIVLLVVASEIMMPQSVYSGMAAFSASFVLAARMVGWGITKVWGSPILWILHVGYAWLPIGFFMKGVSDVFLLGDPSAALHALTAGAMGTMILAVASRAALGHSGKPLHAAPLTVAAYILVTLAAIARVFLPGHFGEYAIELSGALWVLAFILFSYVYWPILTRPRLDGKAG